MEAGDDYYQMARFHYLLTSKAEYRNGIRLLIEDAIIIEDETAGIHPRGSRRYPASEWVISKRLPYDAVLLEWPLNLTGLDEEGDRKLSEKRRERSFLKRCLGKVENCCSSSTVICLICVSDNIGILGCLNKNGGYEFRFDMRFKPSIPTSKFVVSSSFEETLSSGWENGCSMMEETINCVEISIEGGEPSKVEEGEWGGYVEEQGLWFKAYIPGKGEEAVYYQVPCLAKWKKDRGIGDGVNVSYYNGLGLSGSRDGSLAFIYVEQDQPIRLCSLRFDGPPPVSQSTKRNSRQPVRSARQSTSVIRVVATTQEITKSISCDVAEQLKVSAVASTEVEKASLKGNRHEEEGSSQTNPYATAKMAELKLKYSSMAGIDPEQINAEYYEHTFVEFEDQSAHVKELEAELKVEKESRAEEANAAVKLAESWVGRYREIEFPSEVPDVVMADTGVFHVKVLEFPSESAKLVRVAKKTLDPPSERVGPSWLVGQTLDPLSE
ncbi:hypothetical protein GIB67_015607, partial [Kingdonia uniflora]